MELSAFATKIKAPGCLIRSLTLAIAISPTSLAGTALAADLNQHGLTGGAFDPCRFGPRISFAAASPSIGLGTSTNLSSELLT